ncbi:Nuclear localized protein [Quillaja saponaria]|uniref:Nuclear localized protein n=1 Tax=Quillaja saponaria TaxID=32244 RepID=A0AAD7VH36_QUISA|nr:Nuclear localized protein [Quillaja saponaria]
MEPWEALDVDDSDLSSFLRPCKRQHHNSLPKTSNSAAVTTSAAASSSSQPILELNSQSLTETLTSPQSQNILQGSDSSASSFRLIPGPAGAVQAAMLRKAQNDQSFIGCGEEPIPTQEFIRRVVENGDENGHDFTMNPWLCGLDFLRRKGNVDSNDSSLYTSLSSIKKGLNTDRVAQVLAVIKSCTPNGLGDVMVTLKDPTGTIGASIHRKVLTEGEFRKDISVGAVLVLHKVAVFSPIHSACYLNITLRNIIKVISKDSGPPSKQNSLASPVRQFSPGNNGKSWMTPEKALSLSREKTERIMNNFRLSSQLSENTCEQLEKDRPLGNDHIGNGTTGSSSTFVDKEQVTVGVGMSNGIVRLAEGTDNGLHTDMDDCHQSGENPAGRAKCNGASQNSVELPHNLETGIRDDNGKEPQRPISKASLPQWTEEQLDELFELE